MSKKNNNQELTNGQKPSMPDVETIKKWTRNDLQSAIYFLSLINRYPELIDKIAEEIHKYALTKEQGQAIEHLKQE